MGILERLTLPVPFGRTVYVLSDLSLSIESRVSRPVEELTTLLGDLDDPAIVIVAGNMFFPTSDNLRDDIENTFAHLSRLADAIASFVALETHEFIVLPGTDDAALTNDDVVTWLHSRGIIVARDVMLQVASADEVRELLVAAGCCNVGVNLVDTGDQSDADRIEDPSRLTRFVASRVLYRQFGPAIWLVVLALIGVDLFNSIIQLVGHFTHHVYNVRAPHTHSFWGNLILNFFALVVAEALVVGLAGLAVRRRFDRRSSAEMASEPLESTTVDGVSAFDIARLVVERGGLGAIVGGSRRPALAFLDRGVCATPGPSRTVLIEHEGRLGLPGPFSAVERLGMIEVVAARQIQVRLVGGQSSLHRATILERLIASAPTQPAPLRDTSVIGQWPNGSPFPLSVDRLRDQRHQRSVRRWASGAIFFDGLVNIVLTLSAPLRTHLHFVQSFLPLGVAQSAAVITAIAGVALIMLARGVRRGQQRAWFLALVAISVSVIAHLARGGAIAASVMAAILVFFLVAQRRHFRSAADRSSLTNAAPLLLGVAMVTIVAAALGIEASARHRVVLPNFGVVVVACVERLVGIYNINLPDSVTDFADPVLLTVGISLIVTILYLLTRPVVDRRLSEPAGSRERRVAELRARDIVRRHGRGTLDFFALRDDKQFYFFRDSLVAYAVYGGVALISPDPIGPEAERAEVLSAFRMFCETRGWTLGVIGAGAEWLGTYHAAGMHYIYIGDEAIVDTQNFSLEGGKMKGLRQACTRLARHGYTVTFLDPANIDPAHVEGILALITMLRRGEGERGFSMMLGRLFDPKDKGLLLTLVTGPDGQPAAACQFVPSPAINGYSLDLMRRDPGDHPNGLIDYALCSTIAHLREQGAGGLSLNFAAFRSVLDGERGEGTFTRVERWTLKRLSGFLPIESLWQFNAKYHPRWLPRYIVYPAAEQFVPVVAALLRAESLTEIPVVGRWLTNDPVNRPGTIVPDEVLAAAKQVRES